MSHFIHSLRFKLLVASLTLLVIPWIGYRYLLEIEDALRQAQANLLLSRAEIVSNLLADRLTQEERESLYSAAQSDQASLYVHALKNAPVTDGYAEEWDSLLTQAHRYHASATSTDAVSFELLAGYHADNLYLLLTVTDKTPVYPSAEGPLTSGDHLILVLPGQGTKHRQYLLGTSAPGWIRVQRADTMQNEPAIRGEWQEIQDGYRVELRIPLAMIRQQLSLAVIDKDVRGEQATSIAATSGWRTNPSLARLVMPSLPSARLLQGLDSNAYRYTILNRHRQVVGRHGNLTPPAVTKQSLVNRLLTKLLVDQSVAGGHLREHAGRMDGPEIRQALGGETAVHRYRSSRSHSVILSAAYPLFSTEQPAGAVLVEETTHAILFLQQQALERLLIYTLALFLITGGTLLLLATYLTRRITRLRQKFNQAVSQDGRVVGTVNPTKNIDELGDLERSFSSVLKRLQAYNQYLESMASKLAHEFRTPLAMVQSSLENIQSDDDPASRTRYSERALEGTNRLQMILNRLREATRLEQALQGAELSPVDMSGLFHSLCEGYRSTHPSIAFECHSSAQELQALAAPELISQAVDKLVGNAVDFHTPSTPIRMELSQNNDQQISISVTNQGPLLPAEMQASLFQSMVSIRETRDTEPHLGLGLYLVKLIAQFHGGEASAENRSDGVSFFLTLPAEKRTDS
ncbi:MAG: histidine kinase [Candidatus Thiodiazotropha sp. (ex Monitilora ramsayi)]|nr:histidine kinase [Candidatus Thiodiazotropha sp. (ex Monitilora ramsayi)]